MTATASNFTSMRPMPGAAIRSASLKYSRLSCRRCASHAVVKELYWEKHRLDAKSVGNRMRFRAVLKCSWRRRFLPAATRDFDQWRESMSIQPRRIAVLTGVLGALLAISAVQARDIDR